MNWKKTKRAPYEKWESECGNFFIVHRVGSLTYTVVSELKKLKHPKSKYWKRDFGSLRKAKFHAECM